MRESTGCTESRCVYINSKRERTGPYTSFYTADISSRMLKK